MNLIIDLGNTRIKYFVFNNENEIDSTNLNLNDWKIELNKLLDNYPSISRCIISDVNGCITREIENFLSPLPYIYCSSELKLPFKSRYKPFNQLGSDRIALITSSVIEYPKENILIIDLGTCITYDILTSNAIHLGGSISPGYLMRYKALNKFSGKLPLLEPEMVYNVIGENTEQAIHSGVTYGIISEIKETINFYKKEFKFLKVILSGGDAQKLSKTLKNTIFANKNFLAKGLNFILSTNITK